jgi:perosamine synthetase
MHIPHNRPTFNHEEKRAARRVIRSGWVAQGKKVEEFEEKFCEYMGLSRGHAVAVSSGSAALYMAILALEAKGQRVGLPVYTCAAVNNAVILAGGKSILIDNSTEGPNLDINIADEAKLHTLIAVSTFGIPLSLPVERNYRVIEDISQALGAEVDDQKLGLLGDIGVCSFSATKLITSAGQGGMLFSPNKSLVEFARDYRDFDAREDRLPRFNFQMTDIQAAIGTVQLAKLPSFLRKREEIFNIYSDIGLDLVKETESNHSPSRYRAVIRNTTPLKVQKKLYEKGVSTIIPFTYEELLRTTIEDKNAIDLSKSTLSIPIYPSLSLRQAKKIAKTVKLGIGNS